LGLRLSARFLQVALMKGPATWLDLFRGAPIENGETNGAVRGGT